MCLDIEGIEGSKSSEGPGVAPSSVDALSTAELERIIAARKAAQDDA